MLSTFRLGMRGRLVGTWSRSFHVSASAQNHSGAADRTLLLNKLAFDLTEPEIRQAFKPIGGVESVSVERDPKTLKSRGHGSIVFESPDLAKRASMEMQGLVLHNLPIIVKVKSESRYRGLEEKKYEILYIKNLPYEATEEQVLQVFAPYQALRCGLGRAPVTEKNLGYGFVRFGSKEAAYEALKKTRDVSVGGRRIKVAFAEPKVNNYRYIV
ncbi:DEKNAAC104796 [Brettanomyces naardenensis]|uniref:DEKNAAC104796 n=1 Tax=Brettanomyces naardenensis TaxID=13370 RepID=A0A448YS81_BRENA|nr:DEKNAAC104796 [Brettanomyces naardenensis]